MPAPPPESEPAMVSRRGGVRTGSGRAFHRPAGTQEDEGGDDGEHGEADRLRQRETAEEAVVLGAQDLDEEALAGEQAEDDQGRLPRPEPALEQPEADPPDHQAGEGLVELRRMDAQELV